MMWPEVRPALLMCQFAVAVEAHVDSRRHLLLKAARDSASG